MKVTSESAERAATSFQPATSSPLGACGVFTSWVFTSAVLAGALAGCGGATDARAMSRGDEHDAARLYPLAEGNVWSYNISVGEVTPTLGITRVVRRVGTIVEVSANGQPPQRYDVLAGGIFRTGKDAWLLQNPVVLGAEWPSSQGKTARVVSVSESPDTPAGHFTGCVRVEERGDAGAEVHTTYCPDVGPVQVRSRVPLTLSPEGAEVSAELIGFDVQNP